MAGQGRGRGEECGRKVSRVWCGRIVECLCGCINKQQNRNRNEQPCSILASLGHCQDKASSSSNSHDKASSSSNSSNNYNYNSNNPGQGTSFNGSPCMSLCLSVCRPPVAPTASVSVSKARPAAAAATVVVVAAVLLLLLLPT